LFPATLEWIDVMRRVLFVDHDAGRTGSTVSLEYLLRGFRADGWEVHVLSGKKEADAQRLRDCGAEVIGFSSGRYPAITLYSHFTNTRSVFSIGGLLVTAHDLIAFMRGIVLVAMTLMKVRPHLLYANEHSVAHAALAARLFRVPSVIHVRSRILTGTWGIRRWIFSRLVVTNNRFVFPITDVEKEILRARPGEQEKIVVVGEFVPRDPGSRSRQDGRRERFGLPVGRLTVTLLGGVSEIKGSLVFLRAAGIVLAHRPDVLFVIAGRTYRGSRIDSANYERCEPLLRTLQERGGLRVLGEIEDSLGLLAESDIVVSASTDTHFSRPVVEGWGFGKTAVASDTVHMRRLIDDGVNGLLFPSGNHEALASCLETVIADPALRARLGSEGRKKAEAEFDAERNLREIVSRCDALIAENQSHDQ
jgi:glycosyltransferase involved in cell wall biosynthesis